jgi:hypothetical protein
MRTQKAIAISIVLHCMMLLCVAASQDKPPVGPPAPTPAYEPSEGQRLKLENAQLKALVIALQIQPLEQKRQEQVKALSDLCETIRKENKWPDNIKCDLSTLKFAPEQPKVERQPVPPPPGAPQ